MTRKKGGGRESGEPGVAEAEELARRSANPAACPLRIQGEGEAAHDARIRELEARNAELEDRVVALGAAFASREERLRDLVRLARDDEGEAGA